MPPPSLPDDLIEEVLIRIRADDPASLVRAALACRRWCRLVADPAFRRRRLHHHGAATPPMLGFLCECDGTWTHDRQPFARFVPMSSFCPPRADHRGLRALDARHGRVLLQDRLRRDLFVVWDPVTAQRVALPKPPLSSSLANGSVKATATVLCAATATGACDHLDCHRGPFIVILMRTNGVLLEHDDNDDDFLDDDDDDFLDDDDDEDDESLDDNGVLLEYDDDDFLIDDDYDDDDIFYDDDSDGNDMVLNGMFTCTYSSESGAWSNPTYANHPGYNMDFGRSALVGNTLFLKLRSYHRILKYDLRTQEMSVVGLPRVRTDMILDLIQIELTTLEDGRLGFVRMEGSNKLCLWSRDDDEGDDQVAGWTLRRVIDLKKLFPLVDSLHIKHCLVGVVEGACVAFMAVQKRGLFTIDMKTGLMSKVSDDFGTACCAVPYVDFCTPALRLVSTLYRDDEPVEETPPGNPI